VEQKAAVIGWRSTLPRVMTRGTHRVTHRVLILSADRYRSAVLLDCLEEAGYQVEVYECGKTGLHAIRAQPPDLALLDGDLPDLSGMAMTRMLRADPLTAGLPIIMMGWNLSEGEHILALEAGVDFCLTETPHPQVLVARVRALLRRVEWLGA
jgi:DNA-binding response OmpR family regulator